MIKLSTSLSFKIMKTVNTVLFVFMINFVFGQNYVEVEDLQHWTREDFINNDILLIIQDI